MCVGMVTTIRLTGTWYVGGKHVVNMFITIIGLDGGKVGHPRHRFPMVVTSGE